MDKYITKRQGSEVSNVVKYIQEKDKKRNNGTQNVHSEDKQTAVKDHITIGNYRVTGEIEEKELQHILATKGFFDNTFPPREWRDDLRQLYKRFKVQSASPLPGDGLFLRATAVTIRAGEIIGVYAGLLGNTTTDYSMQISPKVIVDGTPQDDDPIWYMGRINDWIWDMNGQNCEIKKGGVIRAIKNIYPGQQLFMNYSET
jgi:hypothetical protein